MQWPGSIAILLHQADPYPEVRKHLIWSVVQAWQRAGTRIGVLKGTARPAPAADLLVCHVDLTRIPPAYVEYAARFPRVLNGAVIDISKRRISANLVARGDDYPGPVIVKTNDNFGGAPEQRHSKAAGNPGPRQGDWKYVKSMASFKYPIFRDPSLVPRRVWANPNLVVEKFIPERENGHYCIRVCIFLGDVVLNRRTFSSNPIVKGANITHSEAAEVPDELLSMRNQLGFDYGKFDYVMHDGRVHLLDANRTPGLLSDRAANAVIGGKLAAGVGQYLPCAPVPLGSPR